MITLKRILETITTKLPEEELPLNQVGTLAVAIQLDGDTIYVNCELARVNTSSKESLTRKPLH